MCWLFAALGEEAARQADGTGQCLSLCPFTGKPINEPIFSVAAKMFLLGILRLAFFVGTSWPPPVAESKTITLVAKKVYGIDATGGPSMRVSFMAWAAGGANVMALSVLRIAMLVSWTMRGVCFATWSSH